MSDITVLMRRGFRPSEALGDDDFRPILNHGAIVEFGGQRFLATTDSYIYALIPVETTAKPNGTMISGDAIAAAEQLPRPAFELQPDGTTRVGRAIYEPLEGKFPGPEGLWPKESKDATVVSLSPRILMHLAKALDALTPGREGVRLTITGRHKPIVVEPVNGETAGAKGLLMPIREAS